MAKEMIQGEQLLSEQNGGDALTPTPSPSCWDCLAEVENFFCKRCGKIQPIPPATDFFSCLGLERKLNFDRQKLENQFHLLSRKFHPDFYQNKSLKEQELSLENASTLNKAYRTLRDPISKIEYLIRLESGEEEGVRCQVPPDLLEEVLELHAELEEIRSLDEREDSSEYRTIKEYLRSELIRLEERFQTIEDRILELSNEWDRLNKEDRNEDSGRKKILLEFRNILSQRTYLSNVIEDIKKVLK